MDRGGARVQAFPFSESITSINCTTVLDTTTYVSNFYFTRIILIMSIVFDRRHDLLYTSTVFDDRLLIWNTADDRMQLLDAVTLIRSSDMASVRPFLIAIDEASGLFYVFDSIRKNRALFKNSVII